MYMLLIDGEIKPGRKDEFLDAWSRQILPVLKMHDGFLDEIVMFEHNAPSRCMGLCFWKTREDAQRYQRVGFAHSKSLVEHLLRGVPSIHGFDVAVAEAFRAAAQDAA